MRCAVGIDKDGVGDVLDDGAAGWRLGGPAGHAVNQRRRDMFWLNGMIRKDPHRVFGTGFAWSFTVFDPVDSREDDYWMRQSEIDPQ